MLEVARECDRALKLPVDSVLFEVGVHSAAYGRIEVGGTEAIEQFEAFQLVLDRILQSFLASNANDSHGGSNSRLDRSGVETNCSPSLLVIANE